MPSFSGVFSSESQDAAKFICEQSAAGERGYRRGYWDGVLAACNLILSGSTQHNVRLWLFRELKQWVSDSFDEDCQLEHPPECPLGRSEQEASVGRGACVPTSAAGSSYCYAIGDGHGHVKIGAADDIRKRMQQLQTGNAARLYLIAFVRLDSRYDADRVERAAHQENSTDRLHGEWFSMSDCCSVQALLEACLLCGHDITPVEVEDRVY
jgi:hypothetical protein